MNCCGKWRPGIAMVAVGFSLAMVNVLLKKVLNEGMNHLVIITYRQSIAAIFLTPIAFFWERKTRPKITTCILCYLFFSALVGATLTQYFFLLGLQYTSPMITCAFVNMVPVNTFVMALPFKLEKVNIKSKAGKAKILGTLVCVSGAMILTLYKGMPLTNPSKSGIVNLKSREGNMLISPEKTRRWTIGSIVLTAGSIVWSLWFLIQAKIGQKYPCQYSSTAIMCFFSAIQSALSSLSIDRNIFVWVLKGKLEILTVIFAGMVGSGLCYVSMSWCVEQRGPVFTAAFSPFIQIFIAVFDISILHEQIHMGSVIGSILIIAGLYTLLWGKSYEAKQNGMKQDQASEESADPNPQLTPDTTTSKV